MDFRDVDKLVKTEDMKKLAEHQQIHLRSVRQLSRLDLFVLHQFGDLVSLNIAIDYLRIALYHSSSCRLGVHVRVLFSFVAKQKLYTHLTSRQRFMLSLHMQYFAKNGGGGYDFCK